MIRSPQMPPSRSPQGLRFLHALSPCLNVLLVLVILCGLLAYRKKGVLPPASQISRELLKEPVQEVIQEQPFRFSYHGAEYLVQPVANYHIRGLVVSHNDITAFGDIYHDEDSVDIKDLCLIWGSNVIDDIFHQVKFRSESVSCHYAYQGEAGEQFEPQRLSNNHLISDDPSVRETIRKVRIGDQVELAGMLVNYAPSANPTFMRRTSTVRTDTGGGACEVMYVRSINALRAVPRLWFRVYEMSWRIFGVLFVLKALLFVTLPWLELKFG